MVASIDDMFFPFFASYVSKKYLLRRIIPWLFLFVFLCFFTIQKATAAESLLSNIKLPPGFAITIYADDVPNARSLALSPSGILFVGSRKAGRVYIVIDHDRDFKADQVITIAKRLNMPNGVVFHDGDLYVAEVHRVIKFKDIEKKLHHPGLPQVIINTYPRDDWHGWNFFASGLTINSMCRLVLPVMSV
jgi:glucose/arabinose dehydrogenase